MILSVLDRLSLILQLTVLQNVLIQVNQRLVICQLVVILQCDNDVIIDSLQLLLMVVVLCLLDGIHDLVMLIDYVHVF